MGWGGVGWGGVGWGGVGWGGVGWGGVGWGGVGWGGVGWGGVGDPKGRPRVEGQQKGNIVESNTIEMTNLRWGWESYFCIAELGPQTCNMPRGFKVLFIHWPQMKPSSTGLW